VLSGRAFAPTRKPVGANFHQQHAPLPGFTEAGGEGVDQGHAELTQDDRFNLHENLLDIGWW
jgi:hypothetical protein